MSLEPPSGFESVRDGRTTLWVRTDVRDWLAPILRDAGALRTASSIREVRGGRGGATLVRGVQEVVVRPFRRGGLPSVLLFDLYFGWNPRPLRELEVTEDLRRRGVPVVDVLGAAVRWIVPGCYRGWLATRYLSAARTLWEWLSAAPASGERAPVLRQAGAAIRRLHDCGGRHPDLNLTNILIQSTADGPRVALIDFDRAGRGVQRYRTADADLARLRRSAHKLDPRGLHITPQDLAELEAGYHESRP